MTEQIIDMDVVGELLEICDDGDSGLLVELIEMFLQDAPERVRQVLRGVDAQDLEQVERAAHSLKGSSGNLGAVKVQQLSEELQLASRDTASLDRLPRLATDLEASYAEAESALRGLLEKYAR